MQNLLLISRGGFLDKHKHGDKWGKPRIRTHSFLMADLCYFFKKIFMHGVMCPFGSRIKYDTHTAGTRRKMLLGACSACLAGFVCVWPSANPHSLHMLNCTPQCHITNISPKLSSHQSDALLQLYLSTSTHGPCRVIHYVHSCITRTPQTNRIL